MNFVQSSCVQYLAGSGFISIHALVFDVLMLACLCLGAAAGALTVNFYWRNK